MLKRGEVTVIYAANFLFRLILWKIDILITGLDFDPTGEYVANIDTFGMCVVTFADTGMYRFHSGFRGHSGKRLIVTNILSLQVLLWIVLSIYIYLFRRIKNFTVLTIFLDAVARCRWSINSGEPSIFIKYDWNKLNVLDLEKKAVLMQNSTQLEERCIIFPFEMFAQKFLNFEESI